MAFRKIFCKQVFGMIKKGKGQCTKTTQKYKVKTRKDIKTKIKQMCSRQHKICKFGCRSVVALFWLKRPFKKYNSKSHYITTAIKDINF